MENGNHGKQSFSSYLARLNFQTSKDFSCEGLQCGEKNTGEKEEQKGNRNYLKMELNLKLGGTGHIDGRHSFSRSFQVKKMKTFRMLLARCTQLFSSCSKLLSCNQILDLNLLVFPLLPRQTQASIHEYFQQNRQLYRLTYSRLHNSPNKPTQNI